MVRLRLGRRRQAGGGAGGERKLDLSHAGQRHRAQGRRAARGRERKRGAEGGHRWGGQAGGGQAARQRAADGTDDQCPHRAGIAEPQLGLGGVHIDVKFLGREVEPQGNHGMPAGGDDVAVGDTDGGAQHRVDDRTAVHRKRLMRGGGPGDRGGGGEAGQM